MIYAMNTLTSENLFKDIHYSLKGLYGPSRGFISGNANTSALSPYIDKYMSQDEVSYDLVKETNFTEYLVDICKLVNN